MSFARWPGLPSLVAGLLIGLFMVAGALPDPMGLATGSLYTEAPGHLWGLWGAADGMHQHGPLVRVIGADFPRGMHMHLMDPVNLIVFYPVFKLFGSDGPAAILAWNALHLAWPVVGALCCYALVRRVVGTNPALPWVALLATTVTVGSSFFLIYHRQGRTEFLPALLYPLHLALLHRWMRRPDAIDDTELSPSPPAWVGAAAAASLAGVALGGWYLAVFAGITNAVLGLAWSRGLTVFERLWRLGLVASLATLPLLPAAWALLDVQGDRWLGSGGGDASDDRLGIPSYPLLVSLRLASPTLQGMMDSHAYLGLLPLCIGAIGAWRYRWQGALWLGTALFVTVTAGGGSLVLGGGLTWFDGLSLPAAVLADLVSPISTMRSWCRIGSVGATMAGVAAALGLLALWRHLGRAGPGVAVLLSAACLLDLSTFPEKPIWPPPAFDPLPPRAVRAALSTMAPGGVVALPIDANLRVFGGREEHALWLLWQLDLRRPVSAGFQGNGDNLAHTALGKTVAELQSDCVAALRNYCRASDTTGAVPLEFPDPDTMEEMREEARALWVAGYGGVLLVEEREGGAALRPALLGVLDQPTFDREGVVAWNLRDVAEWSEDVPDSVVAVATNREAVVVPLSTAKGARTLPSGTPLQQ